MRLASAGVRVRGVRGRALKRTAALAAALVAACSIQVASGVRAAARPGGINDHPLNDVVATAADDAWAVGVQGLASHWDGTPWITQHLGGLHSPDLNGVAASAPEDVWTVGGVVVQDALRGFASHWDGSHWRRAPVPGYPGEATLFDVAVHSASDAYAVGRWFAVTPGGRSGGAVIVHWGGSAWQRDGAAPNLSRLNAVTFLGRRFLAVGSSDGGVPVAVRLASGGGMVVHRLPQPAGAHCVANGVTGDPVVVVGVCRSGPRVSPYVAERVGGAWRLRSIPGAVALFAVDGGAATWAVGRSIPTRQPVILRRGHGGSWFRVPVTHFPIGATLRGVSSRTFNDAWAVGARPFAQGAIVMPLALHWDGAAWSRVRVPST